MLFEFLIPRRPVSHQTRNRQNLQAWKNFVHTEASRFGADIETTLNDTPLQLTLVYLYDTDPVDVDNIIKPIQDALIGLVYDDDLLVTDVTSHRRSLVGTFDLTQCPPLLMDGILAGAECVYVRVSDSKPVEEYLT